MRMSSIEFIIFSTQFIIFSLMLLNIRITLKINILKCAKFKKKKNEVFSFFIKV